jgi:hypothetical protein
MPPPPLLAVAGEQLDTDYHVHELPELEQGPVAHATGELNKALLAHIDVLEAANSDLRKSASSSCFGMKAIKHDDNLISFKPCGCSDTPREMQVESARGL